MPFEREPIFHDRQVITPNTDPFLTTTSTAFVDIPGASFTTKDLGQPGNYHVTISLQVMHSNNNSEIVFRGMVGSDPTSERTINFGPASSNNPEGISLIASGDDINPGTIIKVQWKTNTGTATILEMGMLIDGIPENRIIE